MISKKKNDHSKLKDFWVNWSDHSGIRRVEVETGVVQVKIHGKKGIKHKAIHKVRESSVTSEDWSNRFQT